MTALRRLRISRPACQSDSVSAGRKSADTCSRNVVP